MLSRRRFAQILAAIALAAYVGPRSASAADPILTLTGAADGAKTTVALDLAAMDALPQTSFRTSTPWHEGVVEFSGVRLKDCLAAAKIAGTKVQLVALNDYAVDAQLDELVDGDALLATRQNGKVMSVEDKGPVFLIFPFDSRRELQHQSYYSRAVWQLAELNIE
jgi:hypothetical protein